ncbi:MULTISPECIES: hypothetical protein [Sphingobium]|uniref:hypothetical protein n=1 Tax=Sphingobium TaxID=165695 RepID=UPI00159C941F|nr:hypothetical protein [Sphingobium sp. 15-1]
MTRRPSLAWIDLGHSFAPICSDVACFIAGAPAGGEGGDRLPGPDSISETTEGGGTPAANVDKGETTE